MPVRVLQGRLVPAGFSPRPDLDIGPPLAPRVRINEGRIPVEIRDAGRLHTAEYPAPVRGLFTNTALASPQTGTALVMENFWPTAHGLELRRGYKYALNMPSFPCCGGAIIPRPGGLISWAVTQTSGTTTIDLWRSMYYHTPETLLSGYEIVAIPSAISPTPLTADFSHLNVHTDDGIYTLMAHEEMQVLIFDGTDLHATTSGAHEITGADSRNLTQLWAYNSRVFAIEKDTMNAWYGATNAISGAFVKLPLAGVFNNGGNLMFGSTWSSDSGEGLDDRCVFVTDRGEAAVYTGNPADSNSWTLKGVYEIGRPLHKNFHTHLSGDLLIGTDIGLITMSAAVQKDKSELKISALSYAIGNLWEHEISRGVDTSEWRMVKWDYRNMLLISLPPTEAREDMCFALNTETGAWSIFTGWHFFSAAVMDDRLFILAKEAEDLPDLGGVPRLYEGYEVWTSGLDRHREYASNIYGVPITGKLVLPFDNMGIPAKKKQLHYMQHIWTHRQPLQVRGSVAKDYEIRFPTAALSSERVVGGTQTLTEWEEAVWDDDEWVGEDTVLYNTYTSLEAIPNLEGYVLAPQIEIFSNSTVPVIANFVAAHIIYEPTEIIR